MKRAAALTLLLVPLAFAASPARADENSDLDLIPSTAPPAPPSTGTATAGAGQRLYVENAFTVASHRTLLVPSPPPGPPKWEERLFFDARKDWRLGDALRFTYSGRMNLRAEDTLPIPTHENIRHDLREAYASWQPATQSYLDFGRINVKNGVAEGFNPTDFFKTRSVIEPLTADPAVLREDRLGTLMLHGQQLWEHVGLTAAIAPKLYDPSPIYTNTSLPSFDPMLDRTNAHNRFLLKADADLAENFSPELLFYREGNATRWGANLTESLGQSVVAYGEWSGGDRASLIDDALRYGRDTGTIPANAPSALPENAHKSFQNEALARRFLYARANHLQSRISLRPGCVLAPRLAQLVPHRQRQRRQSRDHQPALVHPLLCARPARADQQARRVPARRLDRRFRAEARADRARQYRSL